MRFSMLYFRVHHILSLSLTLIASLFLTNNYEAHQQSWEPFKYTYRFLVYLYNLTYRFPVFQGLRSRMSELFNFLSTALFYNVSHPEFFSGSFLQGSSWFSVPTKTIKRFLNQDIIWSH